MKHTHTISQNYRGRWSELPEGQYDLHKSDKVELIDAPVIGSLTVLKEDNTRVSIAGFSGYILEKQKQIAPKEH